MRDSKEKESYKVGLPRHIILHYLLKTENEWECFETQPDKKTRIIKFIKKEIENG
jgi:hypothetical protein